MAICKVELPPIVVAPLEITSSVNLTVVLLVNVILLNLLASVPTVPLTILVPPPLKLKEPVLTPAVVISVAYKLTPWPTLRIVSVLVPATRFVLSATTGLNIIVPWPLAFVVLEMEKSYCEKKDSDIYR